MTARSLVVPVLITLLAAFLRLHRFADFLTNIDHAYPIAQAIGIWESGRMATLGQSTSILFANPPGMTYMVLLPWGLFGTVWGVHYSVICLNLLIVPLTYHLMRKLGNTSQAWAASFLAATNPWTIYHSQGTWVQGLLPLWTTLTFVLLIKALLLSPAAPRSRRLFAAGLAFTALTQMYLLAFLSTAQVGLIAWINRRRLSWRGGIAALTVFGIATGLYVHQLAINWQVQSARLENFLMIEAPLQPRTTALEHALRHVTGRDYEIIYGNDGSAAWQMRRTLSLSVSLGLTAVLGLGLVRAVRRVVRSTPDASFWLAAFLWWGVPIIALTATRQPVHIAYLLLTLPAGFVLAAPVLAPLAHRRIGAVVAIVLVVNSFLLLNAGRLALAARPAAEDLDRLSVRAIVPFQATAARLAGEYRLTEFYARLDSASLSAKVGRDVAAVNWVHLPEVEMFPIDRPAVYVRLEHGHPAAPLPLAMRAAVLEYPGGDSIAFDVIPAHTRSQLLTLPQYRLEWPSREGLTLIGYDLSPERRELICYWVVDALTEGHWNWLYAPYAHFTNARSELVANLGAPGLPGYLYRAGDVYRYRIALPDLTPGVYQLELGLFDGIRRLGITFLPPDGIPQPFYLAPVILP